MNDSNARDDLDTPTWMRQVVASEFTARILAKARRRGESFREAQASPDPRASVFINGTQDTAQQARMRWLPGVSREWWATASRNAALAAYTAALEFSEVDEEAAAAAGQMRSWFAIPSDAADSSDNK